MSRIKTWIMIMVLGVLGAVFAPSPVVPNSDALASEPASSADQGFWFKKESLVAPRADEGRPIATLAVGESAYIDGSFTRVNLPYDMWVRATHYSEKSTAKLDTLGYQSSTPSRVKVTRTGESTCTVDIRRSEVLWTSLEVFSGDGTGEERPLWLGPESSPGDTQTYWRVEKVVHAEPEHPVFWIPPHQVPLSRRGTPLWRYKEGQEAYASADAMKATPEGKGYVAGTTVCRDKAFTFPAGRPAMKVQVLNAWNVALSTVGSSSPKVEVPKMSRYHAWFIGKSRRGWFSPKTGEMCPALRVWRYTHQDDSVASLVGRAGDR